MKAIISNLDKNATVISKSPDELTLTTSIRTKYCSCGYLVSQLLMVALVWKKLPLAGAAFIIIKVLNEYASFIIAITANLELKM